MGASPRRNPADWLRFLFGFEDRVDRRTYLLSGALLMVFKYVVEAVVVWFATGVVWTPLDYLDPRLASRFELHVPFAFMMTTHMRPPPSWLPWALVLWTVPFLWIGVSMSIRRAADAGRSPWLGVLFLAPYVNYLIMLLLCLLSTSPRSRWPERERTEASPKMAPAIACGAVGIAIALALVAMSVFVIRSYSAHLFLGAPFVFGAVTGFLLNRPTPLRWRSTAGLILLCLGVLALLMLTFAIEGAACILMMVPIAVPIALLGAAIGRSIAIRSPGPPGHAFLLVIAVPIFGVIESTHRELPIYEVASAIEIGAPPELVWQSVIAFGTIPDEKEWPFRLGIACPTSAHIEGHGVGAVRYCEFTTGAFVEPITVWDEPRRLAFDVAKQPPPMVEWSPYDIHPPHLDGFLQSRRGEFRLVPLPGGRTRLEGSTWYTLDIHPDPYWRLYADGLIGAIHKRVLRHVRRLSER